MAQVPTDLGRRIVHAARLAAVLHIQAVLQETAFARRNPVTNDRPVMDDQSGAAASTIVQPQARGAA